MEYYDKYLAPMVICHWCNGSGLGLVEGWNCQACAGFGEWLEGVEDIGSEL